MKKFAFSVRFDPRDWWVGVSWIPPMAKHLCEYPRPGQCSAVELRVVAIALLPTVQLLVTIRGRVTPAERRAAPPGLMSLSELLSKGSFVVIPNNNPVARPAAAPSEN